MKAPSESKSGKLWEGTVRWNQRGTGSVTVLGVCHRLAVSVTFSFWWNGDWHHHYLRL